MDKRTVLAIVLSILVLFIFRYIEERRLGQVAKRRPPVPEIAATPPVSPQPAPEVAEPSLSVVVESDPSGESDTQADPRTIVVEDELYRAVLDTRGGVIQSWILNQYKSDKGEPFEMVAAGHDPQSRSYPGSLILDDAELNWRANSEPYEVEVDGSEIGENTFAPPMKIILRLRRGPLRITKEYDFAKGTYLVGHRVEIEQGGKPAFARVLLGEDIGPEHEHLVNPSSYIQAISRQSGKVHREGPPNNEKEVRKIEEDLRWVGLDIHYFSIIAIPQHSFSAFEIQKKLVKTTGLDGKEIERTLLPLTIPIVGFTEFRLFLGPKDQEVLQSVSGADLSDVIDFGMFSFLVRPLLYSLKWIHRYAHNYGYSIILLTLLLSLLLFPFRLKQMLSMKKMQVVQPKVKEIQEKYKRYKKTDPRRADMNKEIMAVYKANNVNPLGGCLPLLLQMPLLFAFYQVLASSIELRQAPFVGWIQDLSVKDPYYVLPLVMGATMFISQKMTPMSPGMDPTQAKMMMMMPAIFTIMFLNVSSGLNLYFLCSNIFQIGFQKVAERWVGDGKPKRRTKS